MQGQPLEEATAAGFRTPPPHKVRGPIVDVHTHMTEPAMNHELVDAARIYGIGPIVAITPLDQGLELRSRYPDEIVIAAREQWQSKLSPPFDRRMLRLIPEARAHGARLIKFWFAPRARDRLDLLLDDPRLDPVFQAIADHGLGVLVHVSDPDRWFEHKYDPAKYGTKRDQYPMLETRLRQFPGIPFLAAHLGGDPEHLDHLADLLTRYPNLHLDTSATKWMIRELGKQRNEARKFFRRWAERICFGTDQVVLKESDSVRYTVRYWVHQMFWETDLVCPSPIPDPDADGTPMLQGLDLPEDVLAQMYWKNAERVFGIAVRSTRTPGPRKIATSHP